MPQIDVTDVLLDPIVAGERFTVVRRQEVVNQYGEGVLTVTTIPNIIGSIVPTGDNSLVRAEAYTAQVDTVRVVTMYRLRGTSKDNLSREFQPDFILWKGNYLIVKSVNDYSQYGAGMIEAECSGIDYVDLPANVQAAFSGKLDFSKARNSGLGGR